MKYPGLQITLLSLLVGFIPAGEALALTPQEQAEAFFARGRIAEQHGFPTAALNCYKLALRVNAGHPAALARLKELNLRLLDLMLVDLGRIQMSEATLAEAVELIRQKFLASTQGKLKLEFVLTGTTVRPITMNVHGALEEILRLVCDQAGVLFQRKGNSVFIFPVGKPPPALSTSPAQPAGPASSPMAASQGVETTPAASFKFTTDKLEALNDGLEPASSRDATIPRFTWYPHQGTFEWVEYTFKKVQPVEGCAVYWYTDLTTLAIQGGVGLPESWKVLYQNESDAWLPVIGTPSTLSLDAWNVCRFKPVLAKGIRLAVQLASDSSAGILEWKVIPSTAPRGSPPPPPELRLDDLIPITAKVGYKNYRVNKFSITEERLGSQVLLDGVPCRNFLLVHANSAVTFAVPPGYTRFSAIGIGPSKSGRTEYSWTYQILAGEQQIYTSERLDSYPEHQVKINVDLPPGSSTITLITDKAGSATDDFSIWANPKLLPPPLSLESKAKLDQIETQFKNACAAKVEPIHTKAMQDLQNKYQGAVQRAMEAALRSADNAAVTALREESNRSKDRMSVPDDDIPGLLPALASLRSGYRKAATAIADARASQLQPLYDHYDKLLLALAGSLAGKPAEVAAINAIRSQVAASRPAAPALKSPPSGKIVPPPANHRTKP